MITVKNYVKPGTLEEAYELNQKRANRIIGGMMWIRMGRGNVNTVIDLSGLGLDQITHSGLKETFGDFFKECTRHIVGVQFRNGATVGGSIFGRYGFSDILTAFLVLDTKVKLYKKGIVPLSGFIRMDRDRDILEELIVAKDGRKAVYLSERRSQTDFPVLTCAASEKDGTVLLSIGARPMKADVTETTIDEMEQAADTFTYGSNMRGSGEYRKHLGRVLAGRAKKALEEVNV